MKLFLKTSRLFAGMLAIAALLLSIPANAQQGGPKPEKEVFEAIGMMFAQGSGLNRMDFSEAEIEFILAGIKKGLSLQELPPEARKLEPKIQAIMQAKMAALRQAQPLGSHQDSSS